MTELSEWGTGHGLASLPSMSRFRMQERGLRPFRRMLAQVGTHRLYSVARCMGGVFQSLLLR